MVRILIAFIFVCGICLAPRVQSAPALHPQYLIVAQFEDDAGPAVRLANGNIYRLARLPNARIVIPAVSHEPPSRIIEQIEHDYPGVLPKWFTTPETGTKPRKTSSSTDRAPPAVDMDEDRTATFIRVQNIVPPAKFEIAGLATRVRNQGSVRNSCTWFAATLALESAYIRLAQTDVDLSEQYFNHLLKMHLWYPGTLLPQPEIQVGLWGGGSVVTNITAMTNIPFGLPLETLDPYVSLAGEDTSSTRPAGDILIEDGSITSQRAVDDINLPDTPVTLINPGGTSLTPLSVRALENASYRSTSFDVASDTDRQSLDWYRQRISSGHAIAILFECCGTQPSGSESIWTPTGDLSAAHATVLIGYDDSKNAFLVRNSWGENSARLFSYDFVTGSHLFEAVDITNVAAPRGVTGLPDNLQIVLGRWLLTDAGQAGRITPTGTGMLDIYRIPGADNPGVTSRLGTFFAEDGSPMRVNGRFVANSGSMGRLEFSIDNSYPDQAANSNGGSHYQATYMFVTTPGNEHAMMVGNVTPPTGPQRPFVLRKSRALPAVVSVPLTAPRASNQALIGWWEVYWEGEIGSLIFTRFDSQSGKFIGRYQPFGGQPMAAWGAVNGSGVVILTDQPSVRLAIGGFADANQSVAAGNWNTSNPQSAFVAVLRNPSPIVILPAASGILGPAAQ